MWTHRQRLLQQGVEQQLEGPVGARPLLDFGSDENDLSLAMFGRYHGRLARNLLLTDEPSALQDPALWILDGMCEAGGGRAIEVGEIELRGTRADLVISERGYKIEPTRGGQFQNRGMLADPVEKTREEPEDNMRNTPTESAANLIPRRNG